MSPLIAIALLVALVGAASYAGIRIIDTGVYERLPSWLAFPAFLVTGWLLFGLVIGLVWLAW